jgi:nucleotide-binding universal stress UspA family protein
MKQLIVGADGSEVAGDAVAWSGRLAAALGAEVLAVNCFRPSYSEMPPEVHDHLLADCERALAESWVVPAVEAGAEVRTVVREGDPRDQLMAVAEDEGADLLVLGRTGIGGGPGFLHLGSVVEHAAHRYSGPLAVIPTGWSRGIERIVVGVDGSEGSRSAIAWVADIAPALHASVIAVQVQEPLVEWTPATSPDNWRRDVERHIDEWTAPLRESGVSAESVAQENLHPADGLLGVARARGGDLLVVGTRGLGGFTGLRTGGVALKVLHHASLPLALIPARP